MCVGPAENVFDYDVLSQNTVFRWLARFRIGNFSVEDEEREDVLKCRQSSDMPQLWMLQSERTLETLRKSWR